MELGRAMVLLHHPSAGAQALGLQEVDHHQARASEDFGLGDCKKEGPKLHQDRPPLHHLR